MRRTSGGVIGAAVTPIVATALFGVYGSAILLALCVSALCLASLVAMVGLPRAGAAT